MCRAQSTHLSLGRSLSHSSVFCSFHTTLIDGQLHDVDGHNDGFDDRPCHTWWSKLRKGLPTRVAAKRTQGSLDLVHLLNHSAGSPIFGLDLLVHLSPPMMEEDSKGCHVVTPAKLLHLATNSLRTTAIDSPAVIASTSSTSSASAVLKAIRC